MIAISSNSYSAQSRPLSKVYAHAYVRIGIPMYVYVLHVYIYIYTCVCTYIYIYIYMYICNNIVSKQSFVYIITSPSEFVKEL